MCLSLSDCSGYQTLYQIGLEILKTRQKLEGLDGIWKDWTGLILWMIHWQLIQWESLHPSRCRTIALLIITFEGQDFHSYTRKSFVHALASALLDVLL